MNTALARWVLEAGITKLITFHCARHTYATFLLTKGVEIYTVSKMLGHRELKTTQVYAKIIDQKKREAAIIFAEFLKISIKYLRDNTEINFYINRYNHCEFLYKFHLKFNIL